MVPTRRCACCTRPWKLKAISKNQKKKEGPINAPKPIRNLPFYNTRSQAQNTVDEDGAPILPDDIYAEEVDPNEVLAQLDEGGRDYLEEEAEFQEPEPLRKMPRLKQTPRKPTPQQSTEAVIVHP